MLEDCVRSLHLIDHAQEVRGRSGMQQLFILSSHTHYFGAVRYPEIRPLRLGSKLTVLG